MSSLKRHSPDDSKIGMNNTSFPAYPEDSRDVQTETGTWIRLTTASSHKTEFWFSIDYGADFRLVIARRVIQGRVLPLV
jgi:hypothetical protein